LIIIEGFKEQAEKAHQDIIDLAKRLEKKFIEYTLNPN